MWLAELLGRERGEEVQLKNTSSTQWICDPHVKVHFHGQLHLHIADHLTTGTISTKCI